MELKTLSTPHVPVRYFEGGSGEPLVFFHGAGGLTAEDPFLNALAGRFHVYAPLVSGYGDSEECPSLRDMLDFTLHGWDIVAGLGLKDPVIVGHSMGGMIAAEMAAVAPNDVSRLALICPAGLWIEDRPIPDIFSTLPFEMPGLLFHDPVAGAAMLTAGLSVDDPAFLQAYLVSNARQLGMAGRILFPIPERGLSGRLYRITAKTKVLWGESDRLIDPAYGEAFRRQIKNAELIRIAAAGHMAPWEQTGACLEAVVGLANGG